jgi:hypothetical protein
MYAYGKGQKPNLNIVVKLPSYDREIGATLETWLLQFRSYLLLSELTDEKKKTALLINALPPNMLDTLIYEIKHSSGTYNNEDILTMKCDHLLAILEKKI